MASIREVAKLAHVAPSTVSRALNDSGHCEKAQGMKRNMRTRKPKKRKAKTKLRRR